jgi:hypothetical protein
MLLMFFLVIFYTVNRYFIFILEDNSHDGDIDMWFQRSWPLEFRQVAALAFKG